MQEEIQKQSHTTKADCSDSSFEKCLGFKHG